MQVNYEITRSLKPLWCGNEVYYESFMVVREGEETVIPLLYEPMEILEVRSATLDILYEEGKDYYLKGGKLVIPATSSVPYFTLDEYYPDKRIVGRELPPASAAVISSFGKATFSINASVSLATSTMDTGTCPSPMPQLDTLPPT